MFLFISAIYLRLYGIGHIVNDHLGSERESRCLHYKGCCSLQLAARDCL